MLLVPRQPGRRALNDVAIEGFGAAIKLSCTSAARTSTSVFGGVSRVRPRLLPFTDDYGAALGAADLALSRAGGGVWELAAAGKPAILVPYPLATAEHQAKNARYFQTAAGAILVPEGELGRVPEVVRSLLGDSRRLEEMSRAMLRVSRPDAADEIAEELIGLASARG